MIMRGSKKTSIEFDLDLLYFKKNMELIFLWVGGGIVWYYQPLKLKVQTLVQVICETHGKYCEVWS
jgi:hypothetical protein